MNKFKLVKTDNGENLFKTEEDGKVWAVPMDPANSDYAEYLASLEGKEPNLPEVEETPETPVAE
jgi:hypothetical protein